MQGDFQTNKWKQVLICQQLLENLPPRTSGNRWGWYCKGQKSKTWTTTSKGFIMKRIFHSPWTRRADKLWQNDLIKIMELTQPPVLSSSRDFQQKQEWEAPFPKVRLRGVKGGACKQGKLFTSLSKETNKQTKSLEIASLQPTLHLYFIPKWNV